MVGDASGSESCWPKKPREDGLMSRSEDRSGKQDSYTRNRDTRFVTIQRGGLLAASSPASSSVSGTNSRLFLDLGIVFKSSGTSTPKRK